LNQWTDFHEIYYDHYAIGRHTTRVIFNFLQSVLITWRTHAVKAALTPRRLEY